MELIEPTKRLYIRLLFFNIYVKNLNWKAYGKSSDGKMTDL